jgi:tetratricopeptide (TPR) repeat protein
MVRCSPVTCAALALAATVFAGLVAPPAAADSPEESFDRGNAAYAAGDFNGAAAAYETVLRYRIRDGRVEYNLGNAEFRRGNLGKAILHYERARRLEPTDAEVRANLAYARSFAYDQVPQEAPSAVVAWIPALQDRLGPDRQAWILLLLVWAVAGVLALGLSRPGAWSAAHAWGLAALALAVAVTAASWYVTWQRVEGVQLAVVLDDAVEVLSGPGENNAALFTVHEGLTVTVQGDVRSDWIQVALPNGLYGWVPLEAVGLV